MELSLGERHHVKQRDNGHLQNKSPVGDNILQQHCIEYIFIPSLRSKKPQS